MSTRKIRDLEPKEICRDPEHTPPQFMVYEDGVWEHICPSCGKRTEFVVNKPKF